MCKFCEPTQEEIDVFVRWAETNPRMGDEQTNWEGVDSILFPDGRFVIAAQFDGGYLGDEQVHSFNYCPMCGRKF